MLNFLQEKNKKQIIYEYSLRLFVYLLTFIFISTLVLISCFFPSFFFAKYKSGIVNKQLESVRQKSANNNDDPIAFIKNVNKLSAVLSDKNVAGTTYVDVIKKIVLLKNKDIKISSITINEENIAGGKKILLSGTANTRDSLTLFENYLKTDGYFNSVIFPVSDFIKGSNSDFSITLIL